MSKLLIIESTVADKGRIVNRGDVIDADEATTYALIAAGRALEASTSEAKATAEIIADEKAKKPSAKK